MIDTKVSSRYAKSLFELAKEQGQLDQVNSDMKLLANVCGANKEFGNLLSSPIISADKKLAVLNKVFEGKISEMSKGFFNIVTKKGREQFLEGIAKSFLQLYKQHHSITTAIITTAKGLDEGLRKKVYEIIKNSTKSEVELVEKTDKSLIGGFVLRVGDNQYDASISSDLRKMKQGLVDNSYIKKN